MKLVDRTLDTEDKNNSLRQLQFARQGQKQAELEAISNRLLQSSRDRLRRTDAARKASGAYRPKEPTSEIEAES